MKHLVIIIAFLFSIQSYSQDYVPFPDDSARWGQSQFFLGIGFDFWANCSYVIEGDTLLGQETYSKVYLDATEYWATQNPLPKLYYVGGLREDSLKQIFFRPHLSLVDLDNTIYDNQFFTDLQLPVFPSDTSEYLLYDFQDVNVGDTLSYSFNTHFLDYSYTVINDTIFEIGGIARKAYQLECSGMSANSYLSHCQVYEVPHYLVEGLGSTRGLLGLFHEYSELNEVSVLTCFNGEELILNWQDVGGVYPISSISECGLHSGHNILEQSSYSAIRLFPNPTENNLTISSNSRIQHIKILNSLGQEVLFLAVSGEDVRLDMSSFNSGIYFVEVLFENGERQVKRLIKE